MTKIALVTGGAGFIGSHLCNTLIASGQQVICIDNCITGSKANIAHLLDHDCFTFIEQSICEPLDIKADMIYHLASPASPIAYQKKPIETTITNVMGTKYLLDLARKNSIPLLLASTSEVYGDPLVHPQSELYWGNVNPIGIRACYNEGKRCAESLCADYKRNYKTNVKIVRIFNTYGPHMQHDDGRVVSNFIVRALQGKEIEIYGLGQQTRSFCYVDDLIIGLTSYMNFDGDYMGPINLGFPMETTVMELAEKIIRITHSKSPILHKEIPEDDPSRRLPDITHANNILRWHPHIGLDEGLAKTIAYFRQAMHL